MKLLKVAGGRGGVCLPQAMAGLVGGLISKRVRSGGPMRGWHGPGSCTPEQGPRKQLWEGLEGVPRSRQVPQEQKVGSEAPPTQEGPSCRLPGLYQCRCEPHRRLICTRPAGVRGHHGDKVTGTSSQVGVGLRVGALTANKYGIKIYNKCHEGQMRTQREDVG